MTLEKAIEIKSRVGEEFLHTDSDEIDEAEILSIEAMKRLRDFRIIWTKVMLFLLPGETDE